MSEPSVEPPESAPSPRENTPIDPNVGGPQRFWTTNKLVALGAAGVIAILVAGLLFFLGAKRTSDTINQFASAASATPSGSADQSDIDNLTVDQFYDDSVLTEAERVKWCAPIIAERTPTELPRLNAYLENTGYVPVNASTPSLENTGKEILDQQSIVEWISSTNPDKVEGKKLSACLVSNRNENFEHAMREVEEPGAQSYDISISMAHVPLESKVFYHTVVDGDYVPNNSPTKVINFLGKSNGKIVATQEIMKFEQGRWIAQRSYSPSNPYWILHPEQAEFE